MAQFLVLLAVFQTTASSEIVTDCDVVIAGGSLAALSTSFATAEFFRQRFPTHPDGRNTTACLLEPYDWAGGQLNSVPAIDFGSYMSHRSNLPTSFQYLWELFDFGNPGHCWVSDLCFDPVIAQESFVQQHIAGHADHLRVYWNTVPTKIAAGEPNGAQSGSQYRISQLDAIQRTPRNASNQWSQLLSSQFEDWYSPSNSSLATKRQITFRNFTALIEATELGDVLALGGAMHVPLAGSRTFAPSGISKRAPQATSESEQTAAMAGENPSPRASDHHRNGKAKHGHAPSARSTPLIDWSFGIETPDETCGLPGSGQPPCAYLDQCGQAATITYFMRYLASNEPDPGPGEWQPPKGLKPSEANPPFAWQHNFTWAQIWMYRRNVYGGPKSHSSHDTNHSSHLGWIPPASVFPGDSVQQNWAGGNDYDTAQLFLGIGSTREQASSGSWAGGFNLTSLRGAEQRAYGSYWWALSQNTTSEQRRLQMRRDMPGTQTGLVKFPYLRGSRRVVTGINNFRLLWCHLAGRCDDSGAPLQPVAPPASEGGKGFRFEDTIAIGQYNDDIHAVDCGANIPPYIANHTVLPYYIPYRALTIGGVTNAMVAGKGMAQSYKANAATRLHPEEWSTGQAAGVAAGLMVSNGWASTEQVLGEDGRAKELRQALKDAGQPLEFSYPAK